ncbi:MAG: CapA family protein, partial [Clostridia bacterium]|nr:CapA family protein [Clostridia bacterium]
MKRRLISLILCALMLLPLAGCASDAKKEGAGRMDITDFTPGEIVTKAPETTEPVPEIHKRISLAAVGDDIIYQAGFTDAKKRADDGREYNFLPNYENIRDAVSSVDIAFVNQETLMAGKEYGYSDYPRFNSPQSLLDDLITVGFDVISIANNHMLDMGTPGLADTIAYYKTKSDSVTMIGGYDNEEDFMTPRVVERDGIKIAFVAFTYATNGLKLKQGSEIYVPYIDDNDIVRAIEAGKQAADIVILSMHWGIENNFTPSDDQRRVAQLAADAGAFAIIGHHPHVIQPVEWFTGR